MGRTGSWSPGVGFCLRLLLLLSLALPPEGIRRRSERLRGGRCPHYGRGKGRTELWLSEDGRSLLLVPGNAYRRIGPPQKKSQT